MPFVPASAMAFDRTATRKGQPLYEDLKQKVRHAALAHADETGWRQDGVGHYLWYAGNDQLALYLIDRHRSANVVQKIFGDEFQGGYLKYRWLCCIQRRECTTPPRLSGSHHPKSKRD
jgi:Transposase IS66 family